MPTLFKRANGIYYWVLRDNQGRRQWVSTGEKNKNLAFRRLPDPKIIGQDNHQRVLLKVFTEEFLVYAHGVYSKGTVDIYRKTIKNFLEVTGNIPLSSLCQRQIDFFKRKRVGEVSRITVNIELRTLRAFFYTAVKWKHLESNPFKGVQLFAIDEKSPTFLCQAEFPKLIRSLEKDWIRDVVIAAALTGMRRGEILNLRWTDIDLRNNMITIQSSGDFRTKWNKKRSIPMNRTVSSLIRERLQKKLHHEFVFSKDGKKINGRDLSRRFKRAIRKLGLDERLHFHSLRHSFTTWLVGKGTPIYEVQKLLGHSTIRMTEIYSHLLPEQLHKTVEKIGIELD